MDNESDNQPPKIQGFPSTHWSAVFDAGASQTNVATRALERIAQNYWYPLYCFVRREGHSAEESKDLTQDFFAFLIRSNMVAKVVADRGRFRSFLLKSLRNFLSNEWKRTAAQKRGGEAQILSLDSEEAENLYLLEPKDGLTPERLFERKWAKTVLNNVLDQLRSEFEVMGQRKRFDQLKLFLHGPTSSKDSARAAKALHMSDGAFRTAIHRFRKQYQGLLRAEIVKLVDDKGDVDDEIRFLISALGS